MRLIDADELLEATDSDVTKCSYNKTISRFDVITCSTIDAIPIPPKATNGNMFLKAHPTVVATIIKKEGHLFNCVQLRNKRETLPFAEVYINWWNAPYKAESEVNNGVNR